MNADQWKMWNDEQGIGYTTPQYNTKPPIKKADKKTKERGTATTTFHANQAIGETRNYQYGARLPTANLELIIQQFQLSHEYYNSLVQIERDHRVAIRAAVADRDKRYPRVVELQAKIDQEYKIIEAQRDAIQKEKSKQRKKKVSTPVEQAAINTAKSNIKLLTPQLKAERDKIKQDAIYLAECQQITGDTTTKNKDAERLFAGKGLYWATRNSTRQAFEQARQNTRLPKPNKDWTAQPRWHNCESGTITYQVQTASGEEYLTPYRSHTGKSTEIMIDTVDLNRKFFLLKMRIGSLPGTKQPIFAEVPIKMHRALPSDSYITLVQLIRKRVAAHVKWSVIFTCCRPDGYKKKHTLGNAIAVNLGYRMVPEGIRVAYAIDDHGNCVDEIILPRSRVNGWRYHDDLQSRRDNSFNDALASLKRFLKAANPISQWLIDDTQNIAQWRAKGKLARLVIKWRANRSPGDEEIFNLLEQAPFGNVGGQHRVYHSWRNEDKHLWEVDANLSAKLRAWRLDLYRNVAARWSEDYEQLIIADIKWADMIRNNPPETQPGFKSNVYTIAAPGELDALLHGAFKGRTTRVDPEYLTADCHGCGNRCDKVGLRITHICEHCGRHWDIDYNHCRNLLLARGNMMNQNPVAARLAQDEVA